MKKNIARMFYNQGFSRWPVLQRFEIFLKSQWGQKRHVNAYTLSSHDRNICIYKSNKDAKSFNVIKKKNVQASQTYMGSLNYASLITVLHLLWYDTLEVSLTKKKSKALITFDSCVIGYKAYSPWAMSQAHNTLNKLTIWWRRDC